MGCALCQSDNKPNQGNMCIPENGPIFPVVYESMRSIKPPGLYHSLSRSAHLSNDTGLRDSKSIDYSHRLLPGQTLEDLRSFTESTNYGSITSAESSARRHCVTYLTEREFNSLDIARRKSYLRNLLFQFIPSLKMEPSIISKIVNFTVSLGYSDLIFLEVINSQKETVVFRAKRRDRSHSYSAKCVRKKNANSLDQELDLLNLLPTHPFIISLRNSAKIETSGHVFLILEYVGDGLNLHNFVYHLGTMGDKEVKFYATEIIIALSFIHDHGYLHRDVSLKNMLLTKKGHIKLSDFDHCCKIGSCTAQDFPKQHPFPRGLAPEQTRGEQQTVFADYWQLGWNLVWMRTGAISKYIGNVPDITPNSLYSLCKSLLTPDPVARKEACLGNIKDMCYFEDVNWARFSRDPPVGPTPPSRRDVRMDKSTEAIYYTSIYEFLND